MKNEKLLKKYASLLVELGVALQVGDILLLEADVENYNLVRLIMEEAFKKGAKDVIPYYYDATLQETRAQYAEKDLIEKVLPWQKESFEYYFKKGKCCSLSLKSPHPIVEKKDSNVDFSCIQKYNNELRNVLRSEIARSDMRWCVARMSNPDWATKVFPNLSREDAEQKLFQTLMDLCRVREDNNPLAEWKAQLKRSSRYSNFLNKNKFCKIRFKNKTGTDLTVGFNPNCLWVGGSDSEQDRIFNLPNIPTAEISTSPDKYQTEGVVHSSIPLIIGDQIVDNFELRFEKGKVVSCKAERGEELLKKVIDTDPGSAYLGEVAFVECDSPVAKTNLVYYDTLLDENAACHLALGRGFAVCIEGLSTTNKEDWEKAGLNDSALHTDFMFGTKDMEAIGIKDNGTEILIFKDGKFIEEIV